MRAAAAATLWMCACQNCELVHASQIERGTAARAWAIVIASTACMSTTAALLPVFERAVRLYMRLVSFARAHADDVRFRLQSRKLLVHSADQVERAARTVFGEALTETIQEQIDAAVDLTEKVSQGLVTDVSTEEARRVLAALSFKITCACAPALSAVPRVCGTACVAVQ